MKEIVKCVVWDLDNTLWNGILSEGDDVQIIPSIVSVIKELDRRGILNSIASRNDFEHTSEKLMEMGIWNYFVFPQIDWIHKSKSIYEIQQQLNINEDTIVFVDDQLLEREEVNFFFPKIRCFTGQEILQSMHLDMFSPLIVSTDAVERRRQYQESFVRQQNRNMLVDEEAFFKQLKLEIYIKHATKLDLDRLYELSNRTNKLNSKGSGYSIEKLSEYLKNDNFLVLKVSAKDRYGCHGTVGCIIIKISEVSWEIKALIISCRVLSLGVGTEVLKYLIVRSQKKNVRLIASFKLTEYNKNMYLTYLMNGFKEVNNILQYVENGVPKMDDYKKIESQL